MYKIIVRTPSHIRLSSSDNSTTTYNGEAISIHNEYNSSKIGHMLLEVNQNLNDVCWKNYFMSRHLYQKLDNDTINTIIQNVFKILSERSPKIKDYKFDNYTYTDYDSLRKSFTDSIISSLRHIKKTIEILSSCLILRYLSDDPNNDNIEYLVFSFEIKYTEKFKFFWIKSTEYEIKYEIFQMVDK